MSATGKLIREPVLLLFNVDPSWSPDEQQEVLSQTNRLGSALEELGHLVTLLPVRDGNLSTLLAAYPPENYIVLNWCESLPGIPRSEILVAEILESTGFVYTGSPPSVIALSEDKCRVRQILAEQGIPTPKWRLFHAPERGTWSCFPAIAKPALEHCSLGITPESVVMTEDELLGRVRYVLDTFAQPVLVEDFVDGREFHVSLWGNGTVEMLPPVEMDFAAFPDVRDRLCTYDAKFVPDSEHYRSIGTLLPAPLDKESYRLLERVVVASYSAIGCRDYARIDVRLRQGVFYVLDVNPNADISEDASMACAAELLGYSYGEMGSKLVSLAAERHPILRTRSPDL